jgi:hypothetical protein
MARRVFAPSWVYSLVQPCSMAEVVWFTAEGQTHMLADHRYFRQPRAGEDSVASLHSALERQIFFLESSFATR